MALHQEVSLVENALPLAVEHQCLKAKLLNCPDREVGRRAIPNKSLLAKHIIIKNGTSRKGDCHDNAMVKSFFGTLKMSTYSDLVKGVQRASLLHTSHVSAESADTPTH